MESIFEYVYSSGKYIFLQNKDTLRKVYNYSKVTSNRGFKEK